MAGESLIGNLAVLLSMETAAFEKGATQAQKLMQRTQRQFKEMGDKVAGVGRGLTIGITAPFAILVSKAIPAAIESQQAIGQVNAALASMGPVAGKTSEQLQRAATSLQSLSTFDDDEILQKVTANMLTFGNVSGQVFDRAQLAAVNLSARLGQDLQSSAIQVGKALNDPVKGIAALARVGVSFTESQKEMIKGMVETGNVAGAQGIILGELEKQFGGAAKAAREASPTAEINQAWGEFQEKVGAVVIKVLPPLTDFLTRLIGLFDKLSPSTQAWVIGVVALSAGLGPVLIAVGSLVSVTGSLLPLIVKLGPAFAALRVAALALFANPVFLGAAATILAIYVAWQNWDKITAIVQRVYTGVKTWLFDKLNAVWDSLKGKIVQVAGWFKWLGDVVVHNSYVPDMVAGIGASMAKLDALMVEPARKAANSTAEAFRSLRDLLARLYPEVDKQNEFLANLAVLDKALKDGRLSAEQYADALERLKIQAGKVKIETETIGEGGASDPLVTGSADEGLINPLEEWARTIPQTAAQITQHLQGIAAHGLDRIADGIAGVITGTKSLGEAFGDIAKQIIADLIQMAVRMLIFRTLASAFPGIFGSVPTTPPIVPGLAMGGSGIFGGIGGRDRNLLSLNGSPIARVSRGEHFSVTPANDRTGAVNVYQTYKFEGVAITEQQFVSGLMHTKTATVAAIKDMNRRR